MTRLRRNNWNGSERILFLLVSLFFFAGCSKQIRSEAAGPTHLEEGLIAYDENRTEDAVKSFDAALKLDPQNTEALFRKGVIFQKQNKADDAIRTYRETLRIDPSHFKAHYNIGNLYSYEKANNVQAIFHYRRFLELAPTHPLASRTQLRLADLIETPADKFARSKDPLEESGPSDVRLTGEWTAPPAPPAPSAAVPPATPPAPPAPRSSTAKGNIASFPQVVCIVGKTAHGAVTGSGFIVGGGYLLTTAHEVHEATQLEAHFHDGKSYPATVLSISSALDLALLQIPFQGVSPLLFVSLEGAQIGEPVIAIGCPLGLTPSASQGIISAPERKMGNRPVLQTDVAINPGNSGGPLLNKQGEVVGVVVGLLPDAQRISFALPGREARRFLGETFFQMGTLLAEAKRYSEAVDLLNQSTLLWPQSAKSYNNLGEAYRRTKEAKKAEQAYLKALEINPKYADAHFNIGLFYDAALRDPRKAAFHYKKYLELKPGAPDAVEVGRWLADLEKGRGPETRNREPEIRGNGKP
ncbi:MAG: trypsin-like peptidase domain-containing protein [Candidatus Manganitrophaceae bacterium]